MPVKNKPRRPSSKTIDRRDPSYAIMRPIMEALGQREYYDLAAGKYDLATLNKFLTGGSRLKPSLPWVKPWKGTTAEGAPRSVHGKTYNGFNAILLSYVSMLKGYSDPRWITYDEAQKRGGQVRRGEKGTKVVWWKTFKRTVTDEDTGEEKTKNALVMRDFTVFNVEQCDGLNLPAIKSKGKAHDWSPKVAAETIIAGYHDDGGPTLGYGGDKAYYAPTLDHIQLPKREQFKSDTGYYSTHFHEMTHSTGHETRLNRKGVTDPVLFGTEKYAQEELVAEMGAAMLMAESHMTCDDCINQSATYINGWRQKLAEDPKLLIYAAQQAYKAVALVMGRTNDATQEDVA